MIGWFLWVVRLHRPLISVGDQELRTMSRELRTEIAAGFDVKKNSKKLKQVYKEQDRRHELAMKSIFP